MAIVSSRGSSTYFDSPQPSIEAKITAFTIDYGSLSPIVGLTMASNFNITIENLGTEEISGLNVTITNTNDTQNYDYYCWNQSFTLHQAEVSYIRVELFTGLGSAEWGNLRYQNFLATLAANGTILDERKLF